jgi:uncharacterized protein YyaL (SSP411 family)
MADRRKTPHRARSFFAPRCVLDWSVLLAPTPMSNRLASETSPYLLQHADNPVHWQPWDAQSLDEAKREDKPILLSIGYSACHWCHVMAHESFEDEATAAVMNRLFVNIKVDREERPDLDQIYQAAQQLLSGRSGGWPLTMFLAPDGTPFYGGTYFPAEPRYGLPGFAHLCEQVAAAWREQRESVIAPNGAALRRAFADMNPTTATSADCGPLSRAPIAAARRLLEHSYDAAYGGFGDAPKFPHPTDLEFLLRRFAAEGDTAARDIVLDTLRHMAEGGIHDQLGGGFCRYSVDARWEIPHFEKMLYDNAQLLPLYADAHVISGEPLFAATAAGIVEWALREMRLDDGSFCSSLDADSEGGEGAYYVWSREEVQGVLDADEWAVAAGHWGFDEAPNFEYRHWNLRVAHRLRDTDADALRHLASARDKLLHARQRRPPPGRDDKRLASWNAMMAGGLAHAGRVFDRPEWIAAARGTLDFLRTQMWDAETQHLAATYSRGVARLDAYLDDYACLLAALLEMLQADFRDEDLRFAGDVADALIARFEDVKDGGFFFTAHDHETLIARLKSGEDGATPSGNGIAAFALQRLGHLLGRPRYLESARRTLALFWERLLAHPGAHATLLLALEECLAPPRSLVLRGPAEAVAQWRQRLAASFQPETMVWAIANGANLVTPVAGRDSDFVNAWVCEGVTCLPPVADFEALAQLLVQSGATQSKLSASRSSSTT